MAEERVQVTLKLPKSVHAQLKVMAEGEMRSMSGLVAYLLKKEADRLKREAKAAD